MRPGSAAAVTKYEYRNAIGCKGKCFTWPSQAEMGAVYSERHPQLT